MRRVHLQKLVAASYRQNRSYVEQLQIAREAQAALTKVNRTIEAKN